MTDRLRILSMAATLLAVPGVATAAPPPSGTDAKGVVAEYRLSAAEIDAVLAAAASQRESGETARVEAPAAAQRPLVEGEVGVAIGTGGYRSAYGSAYVPLPGDGGLAISVGTERGPDGLVARND